MFFPINRTCEDVATKDECALPCADGVRIPTDKGGCQDQPVGTEKKPDDKQASCVKADSHSANPDANKLRDLLPELLVREEQASPEQIKHALKEQEKTGRFIGEILCEWGILGEKSLVPFLVSNCRIPYLSLLDYLIDASVASLIPDDICWKYHVLPIDKMGSSLTLAMVNPLNQEALNTVRSLCPGLKIKPILCEHREFETAAGRLFGPREGHDDITWTHIQELDPGSEGVNPMVLQRFSVAHVPLHHQEETPKGKTRKSSPEQTPPPSPKNILLDSNLLLATLFAGDGAPSRPNDAAPAPQVTSPESTGPANVRNEESLEKQSQADDIVSQYSDAGGLLLKVADIMLDSMHETYVLLTRKIPFFKGLDPEDMARIYSRENLAVYEVNETIYEQGDPGDFVYVVLTGKIGALEDGKQVATFERGDIFGETVLAGELSRSETTVAQIKSVVLHLNPTTFQTGLSSDAQARVLLNMLNSLSARVRRNHCRQ